MLWYTEDIKPIWDDRRKVVSLHACRRSDVSFVNEPVHRAGSSR